MPNAHVSARTVKISILKIEGTINKISHELSDYELVEEKKLSYDMSRKTMKKFLCCKWLIIPN